MDLINIRKRLKDEYNCILVVPINYGDISFVKAFETTKNGILYRYFKISKDNSLTEITDKLLLDYFRKMNETNDENNY